MSALTEAQRLIAASGNSKGRAYISKDELLQFATGLDAAFGSNPNAVEILVQRTEIQEGDINTMFTRGVSVLADPGENYYPIDVFYLNSAPAANLASVTQLFVADADTVAGATNFFFSSVSSGAAQDVLGAGAPANRIGRLGQQVDNTSMFTANGFTRGGTGDLYMVTDGTNNPIASAGQVLTVWVTYALLP